MKTRTRFTLREVEKALVDDYITIEQFIQILIDNFGVKKAERILKFNLDLAQKQARK